MRLHAIRNEVIKVRKALDKIDWEKMPILFRAFPRGACGDISDILAEHLYSLGLQKIEYVQGRLNDGTHAWLETVGYAIDITADQFDEISSKVLFQPPNIWHSKYEVEHRRKAGYKDATHQYTPEVSALHKALLKTLTVLDEG